MKSSVATLTHFPLGRDKNGLATIFDKAVLKNLADIPKEFEWSSEELVQSSQEELHHGLFQVINHGVDLDLIKAAYEEISTVFNLPMSKKLTAQKKPDSLVEYAGAREDRFTSKLPWKETLAFQNDYNKDSKSQVVDFFNTAFGVELQHPGCNLYPACTVDNNLTLGTGPHRDPTGLTFLYQDQVGGLEVFVDNKWKALSYSPDQFIVNVGNTFMALTNGRYKSCLHRVLVNKEMERKSMALFVNPRGGKIVSPPQNLFSKEEPRKYPDFTWKEFRYFPQKYQKTDC
ncbi:hypothetical protein TanjilG_05829 [Lupinus angustifolius]|uniref:Fe2OG dioxygenase domain-containing protein n=1 Tax=Lupinus angustifolius TaxID=3871 RepID=A0A4P1R3G1_LUPAN|nr:hypothetical protein TanjilG_05829 [Lupinus angustifolius]